MSRIHQSRRRSFGTIGMLALTLLAPVAVSAQEEVVALAPVTVPTVDGTGAYAVQAARAIAAERALQSGDIGSMQEEYLLAIVAPGPPPVPTVNFGAAAGRRVANAPLAAPVTSMTAEQTRVLAAQQALLSPDLGSLQEEALIIVVTASTASDETRSADDLPAALASGTRAESAHLATLGLPD